MGRLLLVLAFAGCATAGDRSAAGDDVGPEEDCTDPAPDLCGGTCTDLQNDPDHCGICDRACGADQSCTAGQCISSSCGSEPLPEPVTFVASGAMQTYVVPACVTRVRVEALGAQGQGGFGGLGGSARGDVVVIEGETLAIFVGGMNGFNGGGAGNAAIAVNGGGASDVRQGGQQLADRVLVAGGGGGGSDGDVAARPGGAGGGGTCATEFCGGGGGAGWHATLSAPGQPGATAGGSAETSTHAGGAGGGGFTSGGAGSCQTFSSPMTCGAAGVLGLGGAGGPVAEAICFDPHGGTAGGGGGYYGGGGSAVGQCGGGGGGGGSSFVGALANSAMMPGVQSGDGQVVITPIP